MAESERARQAFETYRDALNVTGATVKPTWDQLPPTMQEAWTMAIEAVAERDALRTENAELKRALALVSKAGRADNEENERLRAICAEWLPIVERQLASIPPAPESRAWQTATDRVERLRAAVLDGPKDG